MSEESEMMRGEWSLYGENRYGDMDPLEAMTEVSLAFHRAMQQQAAGYEMNIKAARAIAAMKPQDLVRWANLMVPDHDPEKFTSCLERAKTIHSNCIDFIKNQEEE
jgi:hypothetical protein